MERLEREGAAEREQGVAQELRSPQVAPTTGRFPSPSSCRRPTALGRGKVEPGGLFVADNVLSHAHPLAQYSAARQADPDLLSVTVPDRGLELSVVLR